MSRVNHNSNYLYDTDGETVWEKLRVIRNFLSDRRRAYGLGILDIQEKDEEFKGKEQSIEYQKWIINRKHSEELLQDCSEEIKFLEEFESWLKEEAEKTRIPGKTDNEMYEINHFEELKIRLVKRAQTQYISTGHVEPDTLQRIIKNKSALQLAVDVGIINKEAIPYINILPSLESRFGQLEYTPNNKDGE